MTTKTPLDLNTLATSVKDAVVSFWGSLNTAHPGVNWAAVAVVLAMILGARGTADLLWIVLCVAILMKVTQ